MAIEVNVISQESEEQRWREERERGGGCVCNRLSEVNEFLVDSLSSC